LLHRQLKILFACFGLFQRCFAIECLISHEGEYDGEYHQRNPKEEEYVVAACQVRINQEAESGDSNYKHKDHRNNYHLISLPHFLKSYGKRYKRESRKELVGGTEDGPDCAVAAESEPAGDSYGYRG